MRIVFFFLFILCFVSVPTLSAQTPQEQVLQAINDLKKQITEQEKMIAEAKKNKEDAETIKSMEDDLAQMKQQMAMMEKAGKSIATIPSAMMKKAEYQVKKENENPSSIIPSKKTALLKTLPIDGLSKTQLPVYLTNLHNELKQKLPAERVADVQKIITGLKNDLAQIAYTGVAAWYSNSPAQAALLMSYAASKSPADANTLNNYGAILNLCGLEHKSIPILKYVLVSHPDNSTVLNNLGQAYTGLGDTPTAMMYFRRCIQQSPNHPEANATAAKIAEANGDMEQALEYTEQSLRGAYSEERAEYFRNKKKGCNIKVLFDTKLFSKTEFFEPGSIQFPPNCRTWDNCETVYQQQQAFTDKIAPLAKKLNAAVLQNQMTEAEIVTMGESPFNKAALFKKDILSECYIAQYTLIWDMTQRKLSLMIAQQQAEGSAMETQFNSELAACPVGNGRAACFDRLAYKHCQDRKSFDNKYFDLLADIAEEYKVKRYTEDVGFYNSLVYLEAVSSPHDKVLTSVSSVYALDLIHKFQTYTMSTSCNPLAKPNCEQYNPANAQNPNSPNFKSPQCAIGFKLSFGAGEVSLSCKSFGIEVGQGVKFGYEKDFITKESTLSMGPGVSADIPGIMDAGASAKVYVKFDGNNQPIDAGLSGDATIGLRGMTPVASAGYTMGVNSGFNYSGSSLF